MNLYFYPVDPVQYTDPLVLTAKCPSSPPINDSNWVKYVGNPHIFHYRFDGYLENRIPTPENPIGECFYDELDKLVDENHKYKGCRGTPDQYPASDWWNHTFNDSGGIWECGGEAAKESGRYAADSFKEKLRQKFNNFKNKVGELW